MDQIEEVLSKTDIIELINSYIPLKKTGRSFKALCPFHSEKTPSFVVSQELQIFKCFGCGIGGNAIKFVMEYEKMEFPEALRLLAERAGVKLEKYRPDGRQQKRDKLYSLNNLASEYYHFILTAHSVGKKALVYLQERGINKASIKSFKLGYAPAGWENLGNFLMKKKGYKGEEIEKTGLVIARRQITEDRKQIIEDGGEKTENSRYKSGYYDRFRDRIIFPIFDHRGNIVGFSGRIIDRGNRGDQGAKYINTPETEIYHKSQTLYGLYQSKNAIREKNTVVLTEGEFDVISSHQIGIKNIIAIKGSALTQQQVELLARFTKNFYFCLDTDGAGRQAAKRGIELAETKNVNVWVVDLPVGKDADECIRTDPKLWKQAVKKAVPVYDFYLESAIKNFGFANGEAKKKVVEEVLPLLNKITNEVVKAHYLKKLAEIIEVSEESVMREAKRKQDQSSFPVRVGKQEEEVSTRTKPETLEEYLLVLIFHSEEDFGLLLKEAKPEMLKNTVTKKIFSYIEKYGEKNKKIKIADFVKTLPEELLETTNRLYLEDLRDVKNSSQSLLEEWRRLWKKVEKIFLRDKLSKLKAVLGDKNRSREEKAEAGLGIVEITKRISNF